MSVEQVGPGGVSNSYGVRGTSAKQEYDNDKEYKEVFVPKDTIPLTATVSLSGGVEKLVQWGPNLERERNQQMIDFMHQEFQFRRHDDEERK